ncbi:hypothetical protein [Streptomyces sp. TN58]|uniref:hypothetical protein n=1 Tax=Streptomyces sp. TN58 TaxID=234612 RepID=UPI000ABD803D|nr:hypothetical protein [Streptomyces sp. TN58]
MTDTTVVSLPASRPEDADTALAPEAPRRGPLDDLASSELLLQLTAHGKRIGYSEGRLRDLKVGAQGILDWLSKQPGDGWQQRWIAAGADRGLDWLNMLPEGFHSGVERRRALSRIGTISLLLNRVVLPDYDFLTSFVSRSLFQEVQRTVQPDLAAEMLKRSAAAGMPTRRVGNGMNVLAKMVLHTGKNFDELSGEDFEHFRAWGLNRENRVPPGIFPAWDLLRSVGVLPANVSFKEFCHQGQRSTADLVDRYRLRCREVRDVLIRYLDERRPSLDYPSFVCLVGHLVGSFWSDIEEHHPDVSGLHLSEEVAAAWKDRIKYVTKRRSTPRLRKSYLLILVQVRSFYLDLQEWALDDPSWAPHAVPSPVRRGETDGLRKHRRSTIAKMHQRIRERLPQLPVLVETAERHRRDQEAFLAAAKATAVGETFEHAGGAYRRVVCKTHLRSERRARTEAVLVEDLVTGETIDLAQREDEAFWCWAVIETLRHTGIRREELLEITHLALVSYRMADSGELVPLLQIVPSKNNQERLLLVSPELASVLATIITRLRNNNRGTIPLTSRYDNHEKTFGPMLPHLFQRRPRGHRNEVISTGTVQDLLDAALARTGLRDAAGEPLKFTAHDFRRCSRPRPSLEACPSISPPASWDTRTSRPRRHTSPCSRTTSSAPTGPSWRSGAAFGPRPSTGTPRTRSGASSSSTSRFARSSWGPAVGPTGLPASTNTPAFAARCCESTRASGSDWPRSSRALPSASKRPSRTDGSARRRDFRAVSRPRPRSWSRWTSHAPAASTPSLNWGFLKSGIPDTCEVRPTTNTPHLASRTARLTAFHHRSTHRPRPRRGLSLPWSPSQGSYCSGPPPWAGHCQSAASIASPAMSLRWKQLPLAHTVTESRRWSTWNGSSPRSVPDQEPSSAGE